MNEQLTLLMTGCGLLALVTLVSVADSSLRAFFFPSGVDLVLAFWFCFLAFLRLSDLVGLLHSRLAGGLSLIHI